MAFDFKAATPDTTVPRTGYLMGADSQSATNPSLYPIENVLLRETLTADTTYYVRANLGTVTMTIASPCVVSLTSHGLSNDDPVVFWTDGALPTGLTAGTTYYVVNKNANDFQVSSTVGGSAINTSGSQSGTHKVATGNDSNAGSAATRTGAWLTPAQAMLKMSQIDFNGYTVTVQFADSYYAEPIDVPRCVGLGSPSKFVLKGNSTTPTNCIVNINDGTFSYPAIQGRDCLIDGFGFSGDAFSCISSWPGFSTIFKNCDFGAGAWYQVDSEGGGAISCYDSYTISGSPVYCHIFCTANSFVSVAFNTVTLTGTPDFSGQAFAVATGGGFIQSYSTTFSGSATGKRYEIISYGIIETGGGGATYFPGNSAGTIATTTYNVAGGGGGTVAVNEGYYA